MNQKEVSEIRRRFAPDKNAITHIHGCYVNGNKEIISYLDEPLGTMPEEECALYLGLLKKALSGGLGKNLIDIVFSNQQVMESDECRLLAALRNSSLKDQEACNSFYQKIIASLDFEDTNYLILLAHDSYDVPYRGKDGENQADASDEVYSYLVCAVCPVKPGKRELGFFPGENEFHSCAAGQLVAAPELGFLYPAFDNRSANLYNALFYSRSTADIHYEFIDAVFHTEAPMSAAEQKEAFETALSDSLQAECRFEVIRAVHEQLREKIEQHKENKIEEPLDISAKEIGGILTDCGVSEESIRTFEEKCGQSFGKDAVLTPANIIDSKRFEVSTPSAKLTVSPEQSYLVETRMIDGRKYLLIPAEEGMEINGLGVRLLAENQPKAE